MFEIRILRDHTPALFGRLKRMRWSEPYGDIGRSAEMSDPTNQVVTAQSEIPCRVSSDLHEWRNDLGTVSTRDSAKLQYE
jgi:hypothetical protein